MQSRLTAASFSMTVLMAFLASASVSLASEHGDASAHAASLGSGHEGAMAHAAHGSVEDSVIAAQNEALARNTEGKGFGPQAPRDIDTPAGNNRVAFQAAPDWTKMNL